MTEKRNVRASAIELIAFLFVYGYKNPYTDTKKSDAPQDRRFPEHGGGASGI